MIVLHPDGATVLLQHAEARNGNDISHIPSYGFILIIGSQ